jgi:tryptophan-rich sensory protein
MTAVCDRLALALAVGAAVCLGAAGWLAVTENSAQADQWPLAVAFLLQAVVTMAWIANPALPRALVGLLGIVELVFGLVSLTVPLAHQTVPPPGQQPASLFAYAFFGLVLAGTATLLAAFVHSPRSNGGP